MKAYLLSPCISLVDSIAEELVCQGRDFSNNLVVFPGKRPAHFLRKALALRAGGPFIPPLVLSMDEFVDRAFESIDKRPKIEPLDAVALLFDIHCGMNRRLGGKGFTFLDEFFGIGLKLYRDLEELLIEQVPAGKIAGVSEMAEEAVPELSSQRTASLEIFYDRFYKKIESGGLSTRSIRYKIVADRIDETDIGNFARALFAGFYALTISEQKVFKKLGAWDNAALYFQSGPGIRDMLYKIGITPGPSEAEGEYPSVVFTNSPDTHGQVFALADMLRPIKEKGEINEKVAVVLPSADTLFPLIRHGLSDFRPSEFNISIGYPLVRTPVFGFIQALMELITGADDERMHIAEYMSFLLHPYTKNIFLNGSAETTRIIFHSLEEYYAQKSSKTFIGLDEIESDRQLFEFIMKKLPEDLGHISEEDVRNHISLVHRRALRPFFSFTDISDFSLKLSGLLEFIAEQSTAKLHPLFTPFCESFIEALESISKSLLGSRSFEDRAGYFTFFRRYLVTRRAPFEGTPLRGLQALGSLETRNIKFDRLFILDANEDILPDTKREDSLIPGKAREILGLPTYRDRDRIASYYFDILVRGAGEVNIFYVDNNRKEKSRFVEKILWEIQRKRGSVGSEDLVRSLQYRVALENSEPQPVIKGPEIAERLRGFVYSASSIDAYLACPLRFYHRYLLKLSEKADAGEGMERSDIGIIVHRALAGYFSGRLQRPLTEKDINADEISELTKRIFEEFYGGTPTGSGYLVMTRTQKRMAEYADKYLAPVVKNGQMVMLEVEANMSAKFRGFRLQGRIDSAQKRAEQLCIIDYKTSANKSAYKIAFEKLDPERRETWSAIGSMQLPIYRILYSQERKVDLKDIKAMFLMLGMSHMNSNIELPLFKEEGEDPKAHSDIIEEILFRLLTEITDPAVPFHATPDKKRNCTVCEYTAICGTQWAQR
jgi:ATP-dependent helicase/nuclease subunit B